METSPESEVWYDLDLGPTYTRDSESQYFLFRYNFKPPISGGGTLHKSGETREVLANLDHKENGKHSVIFRGHAETCTEHDALLIFDGEKLRLERVQHSMLLKYDRDATGTAKNSNQRSAEEHLPDRTAEECPASFEEESAVANSNEKGSELLEKVPPRSLSDAQKPSTSNRKRSHGSQSTYESVEPSPKRQSVHAPARPAEIPSVRGGFETIEIGIEEEVVEEEVYETEEEVDVEEEELPEKQVAGLQQIEAQTVAGPKSGSGSGSSGSDSDSDSDDSSSGKGSDDDEDSASSGDDL